MSGGFALLAGGAAADDLVEAMESLEVEENADAPGAFALILPLSAQDGELAWVGDERLAPMAPIAIVARSDDGAEQCIFDGYVLAHATSLAPGLVDSRLRVWGQDASWLLNLTEKTREWSNASDAAAAASIFDEYAIAPDAANTIDDSPAHVEDGHTLMQRGTDAQFLMRLARRTGRLFRVTNAASPDERIGIFARPQLTGMPTATMNVVDVTAANVSDIEISWDVMRASTARGGQALLSGTDPAEIEADESGLAALDARGLRDFAGMPAETLVAAPVDEAGELTLRAQAALIDAGFFVRCTGKANVGRLGTVLRVGQLVTLNTVGSVHSGTYYVWNVRHAMTAERHEMRFELVRNAVGPAPTASGLLGAIGL